MFDFRGKTAFVTAAGSTLGNATAISCVDLVRNDAVEGTTSVKEVFGSDDC